MGAAGVTPQARFCQRRDTVCQRRRNRIFGPIPMLTRNTDVRFSPRLPVCCAALALFLSVFLQAQTPVETYPFHFAYLSKDQGLPHNYCHTAHRARRGFLWFGTQDGLARFDGVHFKVYTLADDSTGLSAPTVLDIDEDPNGYLWIATNGGGLNRFDPVTETFIWYRNDPNDPASLPGNDLTNVLIDTEGSIWAGGLRSGLSRLDPATGRCRRFALAQELGTAQDRLRRNSQQDKAADSDAPHVLWLAANDGIFRFDKHTGQYRHYPSAVPCRDVQADMPGAVWVATDGGGIARFDKNSGQWTYYPPRPADWARRNGAANRIADISWKSDHEFWVASLDQGFGIFDIENARFTFFNTQTKLLAGQTGQSVNGLYRDPSGLLWVFNYKNGVSLLDPASNALDYTPMPGDACRNSALNEPLDFAWNEKRGELYVVSEGCAGFYVFEPVQRPAPVELSGQPPYRLKRTAILSNAGQAFFRCVLIDARGRIWVGARPGAGGYSLYEYLPESGRLHPVLPGSALHKYPVDALAENGGRELWLGTTRGGLFRIDLEKNAEQEYIRDGDFDGAQLQITDLVCRSTSGATTVWFSTREAGVYRFEQGRFVRFGYQAGNRNGLPENNISALAADAAGNIWVGTASQGLRIIPPGAGPDAVFPRYTVKDGLAFNSVHRLALAGDGQLWISTEKGVSVFDPVKKQFETFDEIDGLADTYLRQKGLYWCRQGGGAVFIGQTRGFYSFHPGGVYKNTTPPAVAFTGFQVFGKPYFTGKDLNFEPVVYLKHDQNFFTIQFAALNFSQANRNQYFHQLEGIDPQWMANGNRSEVSYTRVPPGQYRFRVRALNNSGVASAETLELLIVVKPAFYQTWWFRSLVLALFIGAMVWYFRVRLERILSQEAAKSELSRLRAVKAELENKALRAQMNPHFIFNALNTIEALIVEEQPDAASALLQKFSKLVRLVLENSQQPRVSLALELEALELYIQLEAIRLDGRFSYQITVDPQLERRRCELPPMILQPFVENAILHGLRHLRERPGVLDIRIEPFMPRASSGTEQGPRVLLCRIEDNGIGRARAAEINARTQISGKKQSLGTRLTRERVEWLNAPGRHDYRVEIADIAGENRSGTVVTLTLPLVLDAEPSKDKA